MRTLLSGLLLCVLSLSARAQVVPDSVTIVRDSFGVPHIYAPTDAGVAYGLAWANAEDNFHDMQLNLLMARGRLGEVRGVEGAAIDYAVQLLEIRKLIESRYATEVSTHFKGVLEAYAQGVNDYAKAHPKELLRPRLSPIAPVDVLCGYTMSLVLLQGAAYDFQAILQGRPGAPNPYNPRGSNGFALNSKRTADGNVYLVNNSHQPLDGPLAWYEAHLVSGEGQNVLGGLFPGGVSVFAGANPDVAWMHTVNTPDFTDVYKLETRKQGRKVLYRLDGEWKELETGKATLRVKMGPTRLKVRKKTYRSVHGPVLAGKDKEFYALRFSAIMTIGAAEQWHCMGKAENYTEFRQCLEMRGLPCFNIIYADRRDTLMYMSNGNFPNRCAGFDWHSVLPGDTSAAIWNGIRPLSQSVQVVCPDAGYVFNTNNTPFNSTAPADCPSPANYDTLLCEYQWDNNRSIRFQELISGYPQVSWDDLHRIKYDMTYPDTMFIFFLENPMLLGGLDPAKYPDIAEEIQLLADWDRTAHRESAAAGFFLIALHHMIDRAREEHVAFTRQAAPEAEFVAAIRFTKKYLRKHFGSERVPLGEIQRHVRGDKDWAVDGLPDVLASMNTQPWKNGRRKSYLGDSYVQFVRFTEQGVEMETVQPYGSSNRPDSPHYADQVELYLAHKTKPMRLDKAWVMQHAERVYHPGVGAASAEVPR